MGTPSSNNARLIGDDLDSFLIKIRLLRQEEDFDKARSLLETALVQWPESQEVKDLLLQTEKDQLAARRLKGGNNEIGIGFFEEPGKAAVVGLMGLGGIVWMLFEMGQTIVYMARFGVAAPWAVATRGTHAIYYVPAYTTLSMPLLGFFFFLFFVVLAVKSFRS